MDQIYKLQPHRTMHLQGFDAFGAAGALHSASDTGFKVSGVFRDAADFCVLVLWDRDDYFGHPRFAYLPDGNFGGLVLDFDVHYSGLQELESPKWPTTDWPYINCLLTNGTIARVRLVSDDSDSSKADGNHATVVAGTLTKASADFTIQLTGAHKDDVLRLWYRNHEFHYVLPADPLTALSCVQAMWWQGATTSTVQAMWWQGNASYVHSVTIRGAQYSVAEGGLSSGGIAQNIAAQINASDPSCSAAVGGEYGNEITVSLRSGIAGPVSVSSSDGSAPATLQDYLHSVTIGTAVYSVLEDGLNSAQVAQNISAQINASDANCSAEVGGGYGNEITISLRANKAGPIDVSSSDGSAPATLQRVDAAVACQVFADQINAVDWPAEGVITGLEASASGAVLTVRADRPGRDGNMIRLYSTHQGGATFAPAAKNLSGGNSDVTWHVSIDFGQLGLNDIQRIWMTLAPALANGAEYEDTEWEAEFTNWTVTGPEVTRSLRVAGPGSVRLEEDNPWVERAGYWESAPAQNPYEAFGFWSNGRAIRAADSDASLTIETHCNYLHDIYVGTRLDFDCGKVQAYLDGVPAPFPLDCFGDTRNVRRKLFSNVSPGQHALEIRLTGEKNDASFGWYFYFDFLECVVPTALVPDAPEIRTDVGVATDFDTDHTFKLSPQRLLWNIQHLGLVGEIDHYCGVFWTKQAKVVDRSIPSVTFTFMDEFTLGDGIYLRIGPPGTPEIGKTVLSGDTNDAIAAHFAAFINETAAGVWAECLGPNCTVHCRSANPLYLYDFAIRHEMSSGAIGWDAPDLKTGADEGTWVIDPTQDPIFNRAAVDWHTDFFFAVASAGIGVTVALSQELVNPPDDSWVQRFPDGSRVRTATGYHNLHSSHCAFSAAVVDYMQRAYSQVAELMATAGLVPRLQFGEVLWWYQPNSYGMAYYDSETQAAFQSAHGRSLALFVTPADDPSVNNYVDADFLRQRLKNYVDSICSYVLAYYPGTKFELLWPLDVNDPDIRRLNRYVNLPPEWTARDGSGFDTFAVEGFQYGGVDHNVDAARRCILYPFTELAWDKAHCRYLMGWYYYGWPWQRECLAVRSAGVPLMKTWAYDHLCLFGWPLPLISKRARSVIL
jgi:hypothetical protein